MDVMSNLQRPTLQALRGLFPNSPRSDTKLSMPEKAPSEAKALTKSTAEDSAQGRFDPNR